MNAPFAIAMFEDDNGTAKGGVIFMLFALIGLPTLVYAAGYALIWAMVLTAMGVHMLMESGWLHLARTVL